MSLVRPLTAVGVFLLLPFFCSPAAADANEQVQKPTIAIREVQRSAGNLSSARAAELRACLESALHATRKFDLLTRDRAKLSMVLEEQELSSSEFSAGNAAHSGALDAANYLVIPTVSGFSFGRTSRAIPNLDSKYHRRDSGALQLELQVVDSTTGAIRATYELKSSFATPETVVNTAAGAPAASHFSKMCNDVASQFANKLIDTVYPTVVLKVEGNDLWINRGASSGLRVGDTFSLYRPGAALIDPATGEDLGTTETRLTKAKIVRVNPKASVAQVQDKQAPTIQPGDILRRN